MTTSMETTNAVYRMRDMQRLGSGRFFSVIGAHQGDGATFSCANLGIAAANLLDDVSVVMVDGDPAGCGLSAAADASGKGWTDWFADDCRGSLLDYVRPWPGSPSLSLLPVGGAQPFNTSIASRWQKIADGLGNEHQLVLVDCPPFFAGSDGQAICREVDGVFVVLAAEVTRRAIAATMLDAFRANDCNVIGAILNRRRYHIPDWFYRRIF